MIRVLRKAWAPFVGSLVVVFGFLSCEGPARLKLLSFSAPARDIGGWCLSWDLTGEQIDRLAGEHGRQAMLAGAAELITNPRVDLQDCAVNVLSRLGGPEAADQLLEAAQKRGSRTAILVAMERIGDPRFGPVLTGVLKDPAPFKRLLAARALSGPCGTGVLQDLAELISGPEPEAAAAAIALGLAGDRRGTERLLAALSSGEEDIRQGAAQALGRIREPKALNPLLNALGDSNRHVRMAAVKALGELGDASAREPLRRALNDDDWGVRATAAETLKRFQ